MKLTRDDRQDIFNAYEAGDITNSYVWDENKALLETEYPEIVDAVKRLEIAEKTLLAVVSQMEVDK